MVAEVDDGSTSQDGMAQVTATRSYDVYGALRSSSGSGSNHKFCGQLGHTADADTGLTYIRARYYDPAIGRFITEDPGKDGANWYAYCGNNPVNKMDSDGKVAVPALLAAGIIAAGIAVGGFLGYGCGYLYAVHLINKDDPVYKASPSGLALAATSVAGAVIGFMGNPRGALWGKGIGAGALASNATPWAIAAFVIGFQAGMIEACYDYLNVQDNRKRYEDER